MRKLIEKFNKAFLETATNHKHRKNNEKNQKNFSNKIPKPIILSLWRYRMSMESFLLSAPQKRKTEKKSGRNKDALEKWKKEPKESIFDHSRMCNQECVDLCAGNEKERKNHIKVIDKHPKANISWWKSNGETKKKRNWNCDQKRTTGVKRHICSLCDPVQDTSAFLVHIRPHKTRIHTRKKHKLRESNRFCLSQGRKKTDHIDSTESERAKREKS